MNITPTEAIVQRPSGGDALRGMHAHFSAPAGGSPCGRTMRVAAEPLPRLGRQEHQLAAVELAPMRQPDRPAPQPLLLLLVGARLTAIAQLAGPCPVLSRR